MSRQIAALERAVGLPVFDRPKGPRPAELTPAGHVLLDHARQVLGRVETLATEIDHLRRGSPTPDDVSDHPLIGQPGGNVCQILIDERLAAVGVRPDYMFRSQDNGAVQGMVRSGMGRAIMPLLAVDIDDPDVDVLVSDPALSVLGAWAVGVPTLSSQSVQFISASMMSATLRAKVACSDPAV